MALKALDPDAMYHHCDITEFPFHTTAELEKYTDILGQDRAIEAIKFGIGIKHDGYNLYVMGPAGTGKHTIIQQFLAQIAVSEAISPDWCYVNNFEDSHKPLVLQLPAGQGRVLREEMANLVDELRSVIPATFESDEYRARFQEIEEEFKKQEQKALAEIQEEAAKQDIALIHTQSGFAFSSTYKNEVMTPEQFEKLDEKERHRIERKIIKLQEKLRKVILKIPLWRRESREKVQSLNSDITISVVGHLIEALKEKYKALPAVVDYFDNVQKDIVTNVDDFRQQEEGATNILGIPVNQALSFRSYKINVLVDNDNLQGAPVIYEDHPTYQNLVGRVEHIAMMGALVADFTLIKSGALHRANNGYLILDAYKILQHPFAWEGLKRTLRAREIRIESLERMLSMISTMTIEPEPIPLDIKVVLIGDRLLYYLLSHYDPEFPELFNVAADFEEQIDRTTENNLLYARMIGAMVEKENIRHLERDAVARVNEHSARIQGDAEKLTTHMRSIVDLLLEANYWAGKRNNETIAAEDIQQAIDAKIRRSARVRERMQEAIKRGIVLIETDGEKVGQINGLSVIQLANFSFGIPARITAGVRLGEGEVIDIEREVELGGPIHSKGVLILAGFLGSRYASTTPLSLSASLVFEQSYAEVEGDSASSAELYALLSALAGVPIRQSLAVTGSVNQHGQVQAIGSVNEKIEGFYDVCVERGLTGQQGVLIPASNIKHLMIRQEIVDAAKAGKFFIYPVETVDQGIELLTGIPAGEPDQEGDYPEGTVNYLVQNRLLQFADIRLSFAQQAAGKLLE